ncbi:MAG: urease accessory protein UreD [Pseudomonadota bacterium]
MYAAISSSRSAAPTGLTWTSSPQALPRAEGRVEVRFARRGERTVLADLYQSGSAKARFPKVFDGGPPEAVLINLAGGITGADCFQQRIHFDKKTHAVVTTQAAEKIYRASDDDEPARIINSLTLDAGAFGEWLPQETIFFDGGRLRRRFEAALDPGARLLACEAVVFGRTAMGETVQGGFLRDDWRVSVGDRLVFADGVCFEGGIQYRLDRPAIARGGRALATALLVAPDVEALLEPARDALIAFREDDGRAAVSCRGEMLVARFIAADGARLKSMLTPFIETIRLAAGLAGGLPKLWRC